MALSAIEVKANVLTCTACDLRPNCLRPIPFSGPTPNDIVVVGEAPGAQEDREGKPFVGPSGKLLRKWLEEVGFGRDGCEPTFLNAVSCFPHRTPRYSEVSACRNNLWKQLQVIKPKYILLVGTVAVSSWWKDIGITDIRGSWWQAYWQNNKPEEMQNGDGYSWALATYHPAAVLRNAGLESQTKLDIKYFADVALGKSDPVPMNKCVKCGDGEIKYVNWGVAWCWWCWPDNRKEYGGGRGGRLNAYTVKEGVVPPFIPVGVMLNQRWVEEVQVQGRLL